jgi:hypothetical protein
MKKLTFFFMILTTMLVYSGCQEDEDPTTISTDYITACNEAEFDITFNGTNFFNMEDGNYYSLDNGGVSQHYCRKYLDPNSPNINNPNDIDFESINNTEYDLTHQPDGTKDIAFEFVESGYGYNFGGSDFNIRFEINDIGNLIPGQLYDDSQISGSIDSEFIHPHGFSSYDMFGGVSFTVNFSQIDISAGIYVGVLNIDISNATQYHDQGSTIHPPFTCLIDFSFAM